MDMYLNLPYPYWYKEYCLLNAPEQVQKYEDTLQELYDIIGAPPNAAELCQALASTLEEHKST